MPTRAKRVFVLYVSTVGMQGGEVLGGVTLQCPTQQLPCQHPPCLSFLSLGLAHAAPLHLVQFPVPGMNRYAGLVSTSIGISTNLCSNTLPSSFPAAS